MSDHRTTLAASQRPPRRADVGRPLSPRLAHLLRHGDTEGRYGSRSQAAWAVAVAAVDAGWSLDRFFRELLDPTAELSNWALQRPDGRRRSHHDTRQRVERTYRRARAFVADRPPARDRFAVLAEIAAYRHALDDVPWGGQAGTTDRLVADALAELAARARTLTPSASVRELAELSGVHPGTVSRSLRRLVADGRFLALHSPARDDLSAAYALRRPVDKVQHTTRTPGAQTQGVAACPSRLSKHDAFAWRGLGRSAARIADLLTEHRTTTAADLAEATGLHRRTVARHLDALQAVGIATAVAGGRGWALDPSADLDEIARQLGTAGIAAARVELHRRQRIGWAVFLDQRRHARRRGHRVWYSSATAPADAA